MLLLLRKKYRISVEKMLDILSRYVPFRKNDKTERAYWLKKCQGLMANIRDADGSRMVLNVPRNQSQNHCSEYVLVAACCDPRELSAIQYRLHGNIAGIERSIAVIDTQLSNMEKICARLDAVIHEMR